MTISKICKCDISIPKANTYMKIGSREFQIQHLFFTKTRTVRINAYSSSSECNLIEEISSCHTLFSKIMLVIAMTVIVLLVGFIW